MRRQTRDWWRRRSRKVKIAIVALLAFWIIGAIGALASPDSSSDQHSQDIRPQPQAAAPEAERDSTTSEPTTTEPPPPPPPPPPPLLVARVIDGDTIDLDNGDRIRLVQIDSPERKGECYGKKAGAILRQLLPVGTEVRVVADRKLDKVDRYGRLLRYVFRSKKNVNLLLVQKGAASVWYFDGDKGRYAAKLLAAAERAQAGGRGAWGACDATLDASGPFQTRQKPSPPPPPPPPSAPSNCHSSYVGACLDPNSSDYDCEGGSGNGPDYTGIVRVVGYDEYDLDADGDGYGCE